MFAEIPEILDEVRAGRMVILVDDEDRENEGDLMIAAEKVTPEAVNFMASQGRGLICLALTKDRIEELQIPPMAPENTSRFQTAFHVSVEAASGVTTGISAHDRAHTIQVAIDPASKPKDLARPGHVFPLQAREGGVLVRAGQTEGSVDLARLAGLNPSAVICEVMKDDGTMARVPDLAEFAKKHEIKLCTGENIDPSRWETAQCPKVPTLLESFVRCAGEGEAGAPDFARGAEVQLLLDSCFESDRTGRVVDLMEFVRARDGTAPPA